jgi:hypothetical protein
VLIVNDIFDPLSHLRQTRPCSTIFPDNPSGKNSSAPFHERATGHFDLNRGVKRGVLLLTTALNAEHQRRTLARIAA